MKIGFKKLVDEQCVMRKINNNGNVFSIINYFVDELVITNQKGQQKS